MNITYKEDITSFQDLKDKCWSGALDTLQTIEEKGKEERLLQLLEELCESFNGFESLTYINDLLWFDTEFVYESLDIDTDEDGGVL